MDQFKPRSAGFLNITQGRRKGGQRLGGEREEEHSPVWSSLLLFSGLEIQCWKSHAPATTARPASSWLETTKTTSLQPTSNSVSQRKKGRKASKEEEEEEEHPRKKGLLSLHPQDRKEGRQQATRRLHKAEYGWSVRGRVTLLPPSCMLYLFLFEPKAERK